MCSLMEHSDRSYREEIARQELSKAGVIAEDILNGGLDGAVALASAGSLGSVQAAEIASSAMTQFGLEGKDIPHIADLLAAAAEPELVDDPRSADND